MFIIRFEAYCGSESAGVNPPPPLIRVPTWNGYGDGTDLGRFVVRQEYEYV